MKKILVVLITVMFTLLALFPYIGNSFIQNYTEKGFNFLSSNGIKLSNIKTDVTYLKTSKHFEFVLDDSTVIINYLNSHSRNKVSPSIKKMLDGTLFGVDLKYSNFFLSRSIDLDVYPIELSESLQNKLKKDDNKFYQEIAAFIKDKGILYHMKYDIRNKHFTSYMKDISKTYTLKDSTEFELKLIGSSFNGVGDLELLRSTDSKIDTFCFVAKKDKKTVKFEIENFTSKTNFVSIENYDNSIQVRFMNFELAGTGDDINISIDKSHTFSKVFSKDDRLSMNSMNHIDKFSLKTKKLTVVLMKLNSDIGLKDLKKEPLEKLRIALSKSKNVKKIIKQKEYQDLVMKVLLNGFKFNISDLSVENITFNKNDKLGGIKLDSMLALKEDSNLSTDIKHSALVLLSNLTLHSDIKVSKKIYNVVLKKSPAYKVISSYAKKDKDDLLFKIELKNSKISVNNKKIN